MKNCGNLPYKLGWQNTKAWLITNKFITEHNVILDQKGLRNIALPKIRERGLELGYTGQVGSFEDMGRKFLLSPIFFSNTDAGITNIPTQNPTFSRDTSTIEELKKQDIINNIQQREFIESLFEEDMELSERMLKEQEGDFGDTNYSMATFEHEENNDFPMNEFINFKDWKNIRLSLLEQLEKTKQSLLNKKASIEELSRINDSISKLQKELEDFDETAIENVHFHVINEIEELNNIIDDSIQNTNTAARNLLNNRVQERLDNLEKHFSNNLYVDDRGFETSHNFNAGLPIEKVNETIGKISTLRNKYNKNLENILYNIITNTDNVRLLEQVKTPEQLQEYLDTVKKVLNPESTGLIDIDTLRKRNTLGAKSYGDLLAAVLSTERDLAANKEAGLTSGWKKKLGDAWKNLKYKKVGDEYLVDRFFQKDEFGQRDSKLINMYSPEFYSLISSINRFGRDFFITKENKGVAYKYWMDFLHRNVDYIDLSKISSFVSDYKDNTDFKEFFTSSASEMQAYEQELINKMGETAFTIELQKQREAVNNYLSDSFKNTEEKYHKNPLRFIKNFYSENYDSYDPSTFEFIIPSNNYLRYVPKLDNKSFFNSQFRELEQSEGTDFKDFYINALNLINYTKSVMDSERALGNHNYNYDFNDIINISEHYNVEIARQLGFFGDVYAEVKTFLREIKLKYSQATFQEEKISKFSDLEILTHYSSYGQSEMRKMKIFYTSKPFSELISIAEGLNLKIPDKYKKDSTFTRNKLAEAIIRNTTNKRASLDLHKRIVAGASLAESINTRRSVMGLAGMIQDYNTVHEKTDRIQFMNTWIQQNIGQVGFLKKGGTFSKIERTKFFNKKHLSHLEKEMKKAIESSLKEGTPIEFFDFKYDNNSYFQNDEGQYIKQNEETGEETIINSTEIREAQEQFFRYVMNSMGKNLTVGSVVGGILANFRASNLALNPASGITNREAGYHQNNQGGASGLHGFNTDDLFVARKFLVGARTINTIEYSPWLAKRLGIENFNRAKQWKVLNHLAENLSLLENVMNDLDLGNGVVLKKGTWKNFLSDFAVNNAEFHNQMEILVAMMQNVKIEKIEADGTISLVPLFNPQTLKFPFNPDTMMLLPEYRTENNIANWENFVPDTEGRAPHSKLVTQYNITKHKLHGNYDTNDKIALESSITGKTAIAFQKWIFENIENEWGRKDIDFITGEVNVKGRKVVLSEHIPTLFTYLALQNVLTSNRTLNSVAALAMGIGGATMLFNPAVAVSTMLVSLTPVIYFNRQKIFNAKNLKNTVDSMMGVLRKDNKEAISNTQEELILSMSFLKEVLFRTLRTALTSTTRGVIGPQLKESTIRRLSGIEKKESDGSTVPAYEYRNLSHKDRALISESAQQVADKISTIFRYYMIGTALKAAYLMASGIGEDDEDKVAELEKLEKFMKFLINKKHQTIQELEIMTNPKELYDMLSTRIMVDWAERNLKELVAIKKWYDGEITSEEAVTSMLLAGTHLFLGTPKTVTNTFYPDKGLFQNDRVYDSKSIDFLDKALLNSHKPLEKQFEEDARSKRRNFSKNVKKYLNNNIEKQNPELSKEEKEKKVNAAVQRIYKEEGIEFNDYTNWEELSQKDYRTMLEKYKHKEVPMVIGSGIKKKKPSKQKKKRKGE